MLHAKKSLGQHFLRPRNILKKIAEAAPLSQDDTVLEVGPGEGLLTQELLSRAGRVIAVEKDDRLVPALREKFKTEIAAGRLVLIHADILEAPFAGYPLPSPYKIVANLPYYITGAFLRAFLQTDNQPESMTLLLQKEVAKRIIASNGRESILSISVKCYAAPRYVGDVPRGAFSPPPQVESGILVLEAISKKFFKESGIPEERFFQVLKRGFAHPRKQLAGNLGLAGNDLARIGLGPKIRPEELTASDWQRLCRDILRQDYSVEPL